MSGFGRGGRGAALLKLLDEPRRPGASSSPRPEPVKFHSNGDSSRVGPVPSRPKGRGFMLAALGQQLTGKEESNGVSEPRMPSGKGDFEPKSYGRGFSPIGESQLSRVSERHSPPQGVTSKQSPPPSSETAVDEQMKKIHISIENKENKIGTCGTRVELSANYIHLRCETDAVYQYAVSYEPQIDSRNMRAHLLYQHSDVIGSVRAFDGATLYLPIKVQSQVFKSIRPTDKVDVMVNLKLVKELPPEACISVYNVIFRRVMDKLKLKQVGRHYFDPSRSVEVPQHKLQIWPGYITAINEYDGGLMLQTDMSHKVLCYETVLESMTTIIQHSQRNFREVCTRELIGSVVLTRYNNKTYRIDDIAWDKNPKCTFTLHNGQETSFVDYYRRSYNKEIKDLNQPLLISRPKKKDKNRNQGQEEVICLIPELSYRTGLTDAMRADFRVMKDLATHTRITPNQRHFGLTKFVERLYGNPEILEELQKWNIRLDKTPIRLEGRILPKEKIHLRGKAFIPPIPDWGREVCREKVISAVDLTDWVVVFSRRDAQRTTDFIQMMFQVTRQMGINMSDPVRLEIPDDRTESYLRVIRDAINPRLQLVVIIFPTSRDDRYNAVKKLCCYESAVPSQVIISKTIGQANKLRSVVQKIALQINCKLGGELWSLDIPLKRLMVVGIDVYHDSPRNKKSIGAFVASTNNLLTRWYSRVCFQMPHQELIDGLRLCFLAAIKKYAELNHALPEKIIIFRDGVGDGQLSMVADYEQKQLSECFASFGANYNPSLAIVVVQKRINTRILGTDHTGQMTNPAPGVVVDHSITRKGWYDFFLVSQHVRQGTLTPTHYVVVHDKTTLKPDHMQRLAYKLTHLYYNWPGTVRVPAPCQYAHKLAYLVGQNIQREPHLSLADKLYFL
ncbi:piwi-like protein 1 [Anneissia japonica]|uniref:piwi-like protein 1 n=1 Tax=Anneissia japonica TaxID=1529436 RepID=UPI00142573FA|nr:piwi-like protein 1 [Anneissia japonica]XP_033118834.1 piwi-like protein 1 [Anneissia japonica]XP_033118835.1 piwi-like protein 1 [Anneissia japonica]